MAWQDRWGLEWLLEKTGQAEPWGPPPDFQPQRLVVAGWTDGYHTDWSGAGEDAVQAGHLCVAAAAACPGAAVWLSHVESQGYDSGNLDPNPHRHLHPPPTGFCSWSVRYPLMAHLGWCQIGWCKIHCPDAVVAGAEPHNLATGSVYPIRPQNSV